MREQLTDRYLLVGMSAESLGTDEGDRLIALLALKARLEWNRFTIQI